MVMYTWPCRIQQMRMKAHAEWEDLGPEIPAHTLAGEDCMNSDFLQGCSGHNTKEHEHLRNMKPYNTAKSFIYTLNKLVTRIQQKQ